MQGEMGIKGRQLRDEKREDKEFVSIGEDGATLAHSLLRSFRGECHRPVSGSRPKVGLAADCCAARTSSTYPGCRARAFHVIAHLRSSSHKLISSWARLDDLFQFMSSNVI